MFRTEDAGTDSVWRARADKASGKLIHIGFANEYGTGIEKLLHNSRGLFRRVREGGTSRCCLHACNVEVVFDSKGNSVERKLVCGVIGLKHMRADESLFARDKGDTDGTLACVLDCVINPRHLRTQCERFIRIA